MAEIEPADEFERGILAQHGPAGLRAVRRYMSPPPAKLRPKIVSSEPPAGQQFPAGRTMRRAGLNDSR